MGLGICNQRETIVCWDEEGNPLYNAIVWCDSRTLEICEQFSKIHGDFKGTTGLPVSTYFSLFKILWLVDNVPEIQKKFEEGKIKFGTIDSWLAYKLTGKHVTDASNASRTYLCNIKKAQWDEELLNISRIREDSLPRIVSSFEPIGRVKDGGLEGVELCSILGDQQSSAFAHNLSTS